MPTTLFHTLTFLAATVLTLCWSESLLHVAGQMVPEVEMDPMEWSSEVMEEEAEPEPVEEVVTDPPTEASPEPENSEEHQSTPPNANTVPPATEALEPENAAEQTVAEADQEQPRAVPPPESDAAGDTEKSSAPPPSQTAADEELISPVEVPELVGDEAGSLASFAGDSPTGDTTSTGETEGSGQPMKISFVFIGRPEFEGMHQRAPLQPVLMRQSGEGIEVAVIDQRGPGQPHSLKEFSQRSPQFAGHTFVRLPRDWMVGLHGWTLGRGHGWAMYLAVADPLFREWMQQAKRFADQRKLKLTDVSALQGELRFPRLADGKPTLRFVSLTARPAQPLQENSQ